ncbi:alpha/beta-hydrolase [Hortaea werneckii]|uniref:AB hydrolase-1 domain-containing protein n=1 Tax=Hortaea werneckii TaxID=91943 RepID=A0A3M7FED1_HORWE|nr:alpha/beta-hydrolase [Hortaea werneckii]KAI7571108.1 alpha/beta-hydrolase [Hortaea werneckii]KAI7625680.1 alpha/beta-hydrolase [Hortaea werneckii]KAI7636490.1 alpha/beta-hydrolase [Hortaea werneckii]KAI7673953.1 alpha/beta-hydrolase [Hortaea werneckii]
MYYLKAQLPNGLSLAYRVHPPLQRRSPQGTIVLIHGFPQTSYQFRHVLPLLAAEGFRCIAPDYRGAGSSSKPNDSFDKTTMAQDIYHLLDVLDLKERVHLLGHDIGGMVAFAFAHQYPERLKSVCWGECPLPGTQTYYRDKQDLKRQVQQFHFIFHQVSDLPEALVKGNERSYITHFYNKIGYKVDALSKEDIDQYAAAYEQPGAMRCAFGLYRAFEKDADDTKGRLAKQGKCSVPTLILSGERSHHRAEAEEMALEVTENDKLQIGIVKDAAHWLAEENPAGFVEELLAFIKQHS